MNRLAAISAHVVTPNMNRQIASATSASTNTRKTIVVTGCTSGLGAALVENYVKLGHRVVGCGRRPERIAQLQKQYDGDHCFAVCDVADEASVASWARSVLSEVSSCVDVLINNAGIEMGGGIPLWTVSKETWDKVFSVNVHGVLNVMRYIVPAMVKRGSGLIVNISSGTGHSTFDSTGNGVYSTSKWAVESISKCVAMTLPPGIICVPWAPGIVKTEMNTSDKYPTARQWGVIAAPLILNLGDSPSAEEFNGASMVMPGYCALLCC